jgi:hypothetical protein
VEGESERMWKEVVVTCFEELTDSLSEETEQVYKELQTDIQTSDGPSMK